MRENAFFYKMKPFRSVWSWCSLRLQNWLLSVLSLGSVPNHIAFIMDGNRRFAKLGKMKAIEGHALGWKSLEKTLSWCFTLGVRIVTVYAFSIENFKRDPIEVAYLFDMVIEKLNYLLSHSDQIDLYKVRIRILGQIELLPLDVQKAIYTAEKSTQHHLG
ncbi:hypothetical protein HMI54_010385 [Coelomomyces lativittatus]|nr:hypothetical protein HMI55_004874 [Coelomomyces lativittatus]KAJ1500947.1 hypothetical protein HMI54_010385 [Coelomomyces lativittatus]KAJ1501956.1 hypothetical protein HMI56_002951 [Coelomomyces lativittatus]